MTSARKTTLAELITPAPHAVQGSTDLDDAQALMTAHRIRHLPVLEGDAVVGILSERDVRAAQNMRDPLGRPRLCVHQACTRPPYLVDVRTSVAQVARAMEEQKIGCAIVTAQGKLAGIVTTTDLAGLLADRLGDA